MIRAGTRGDVREALDTAASEAGGYRVEGPEIDRIEFPDQGSDEHVDVSLVKPNPERGAKQATVDGQKATVLGNARGVQPGASGRPEAHADRGRLLLQAEPPVAA